MGQMIGEAAGFISAPVHSSVSGKVIAIEDRPHANRGMCLSVVIENDHKDEVHESVQPKGDLENLTPAPAAEGEGPVPAPTPAVDAAPAEQPAA